MTRFIDAYDAAMFDLDGVVYLGPDAVVGSSDSIAALRGLGVKIGFVTNNAGRPAGVVVDHLNELGIECQLSDVVTSAQAISQVMARELPAGAKVLVCGAAGLAEEVAAVGLTVVRDHRDEPVAVVQGYDPDLDWKVLEQAGFAIQRGARWFGTNPDINRPTNLGMVPGAGAQIRALGTAVDAPITMAGKPFPPLLLETIKRPGAQRPVFVGDRLDTDIEGAYNVDIEVIPSTVPPASPRHAGPWQRRSSSSGQPPSATTCGICSSRAAKPTGRAPESRAARQSPRLATALSS